MKPAQRIFYALGMALATWTTAGVAAADQSPSKVEAQKLSISATVEKIDTTKRELSVKDEQGHVLMMSVPEDVTRFDEIKKGDRINVDYFQSVALSMTKSPEAGAQPSSNEAIAERYAGNLPGGMVGRKITATAEVIKVDRTDNRLTIKGPNGEIDTINVSDPAMQPELGKLHKGDHIKASYSEALAVSVVPKSKDK